MRLGDLVAGRARGCRGRGRRCRRRSRAAARARRRRRRRCRPRSLRGGGHRGWLRPDRARPQRSAHACSDGNEPAHIAGISKTAYVLATPAALTGGMSSRAPHDRTARRVPGSSSPACSSASVGYRSLGCLVVDGRIVARRPTVPSPTARRSSTTRSRRRQPRSRAPRCPAPGGNGCRRRRRRALRRQRLALPRVPGTAAPRGGREVRLGGGSGAMGGHARHVGARVGRRGRHRARRRHGVAVRTRRRVRAVPDLRQRALALRAAPRSRRSRLPAAVRRPHARSADAAVTGLGLTVYGCEPDEADAVPRARRRGSGSCPRSRATPCRRPASSRCPATDASAWATSPRSPRRCCVALKDAGVEHISTRSIGVDHIDLRRRRTSWASRSRTWCTRRTASPTSR